MSILIVSIKNRPIGHFSHRHLVSPVGTEKPIQTSIPQIAPSTAVTDLEADIINPNIARETTMNIKWTLYSLPTPALLVVAMSRLLIFARAIHFLPNMNGEYHRAPMMKATIAAVTTDKRDIVDM